MMKPVEMLAVTVISISLLVNVFLWRYLFMETRELDQLSEDLRRARKKLDRLRRRYRENYEVIESFIAGYYEEQIDAMSATKTLAEIIAPPELPCECGSTENPCTKEYFSEYSSKLRAYVLKHGTVYELIEDLQVKVQQLSDDISKFEIKLSKG